jgi:hypothetical protein
MWVLFWKRYLYICVCVYKMENFCWTTFLDFKFYVLVWCNICDIYSLLQAELQKISYEDSHIEHLQDERRQLLSEIRNLKERIDTFVAR